MARKRFTSLKSAESFAKRVNGQVNDCTNIEGAKSNYTVTYKKTERKTNYDNSSSWSPEDDRDFGYPNWYWK